MDIVYIYTIIIAGLVTAWRRQPRSHYWTKASSSREEDKSHEHRSFASRKPNNLRSEQLDLHDQINLAAFSISHN
jgi:hypothetical protein